MMPQTISVHMLIWKRQMVRNLLYWQWPSQGVCDTCNIVDSQLYSAGSCFKDALLSSAVSCPLSTGPSITKAKLRKVHPEGLTCLQTLIHSIPAGIPPSGVRFAEQRKPKEALNALQDVNLLPLVKALTAHRQQEHSR